MRNKVNRFAKKDSVLRGILRWPRRLSSVLFFTQFSFVFTQFRFVFQQFSSVFYTVQFCILIAQFCVLIVQV